VIPTSARATSDVRDAMVKIYQVENRPDYDNPWDRHGPQTSSGSGCIISGRCILTSAHVVSDATFLQVQRHAQAKKYTARVVAAAHDADWRPAPWRPACCDGRSGDVAGHKRGLEFLYAVF
jgi:S1-C subfamily serine protease